MQTALFVNGVFENVLTEILEAQTARGGGESFLQPKSKDVIQMLKNNLARSDYPGKPSPKFINSEGVESNPPPHCYNSFRVVRHSIPHPA
jgi:hypothetical protein